MNGSNPGRRAFFAGTTAALFGGTLVGCLDSDEDDQEPEPVVDAATSLEGDTDPDVWRDVDTLVLDGYVGGWVGVSPDPIDRVENPTLVLFEGREYEFTWENKDGVHHSIAFWNDDEEVVDEYATDGTDVVGETETLVFEATPEMATYRCEYQPAGQVGDVLSE